MISLPIPEFGDFIAGFATCAGAIVVSVAAKHAWPKLKAVFAIGETAAYRDYKAAINFIDEKVNGLSNAAASAVNTIRGDVQGMQKGMAYLEDRIFTLEKAVGIADPTQDPKQPPAPTQALGAINPAPAPVSLT